MERSHLTRRRPKKLLEKLKYLIIGARCHQWMYDGPSMSRLLTLMGFQNPQILSEGSTTIPDPGELDLHERAGESIYIEAYNS